MAAPEMAAALDPCDTTMSPALLSSFISSLSSSHTELAFLDVIIKRQFWFIYHLATDVWFMNLDFPLLRKQMVNIQVREAPRL